MEVQVLGTGAADGWPTPFCHCSSCTAERLAGRVRGQTSALVDGRVLLDCGPMTPYVAERAGASLADVELLLLTHQHSDHCSPAVLLHRSWVTSAPLVVAGPPDVVAACRDWVAPDAPVVFRAVRPGDEVEVAGHRVRVLSSSHRTGLGDGAPDCVLYDVAAPDGGRLLYATDTGPLPRDTLAAVRDAAYDVVLLEETFGDRSDLPRGHLDLPGFAAEVRRLREAGAVVPDTRVVAVHLSHHNPPTPDLARRLADVGATVVDDGTVLGPGPREPGRPAPGARRTLVLGGARSGKSTEAERVLAAEPEVTYVATGYPPDGDDEWAARVARHRSARPGHWLTVETTDLVPLLREPGAPLLVDCLTLWLTRTMDTHDAWDGRPGAGERVDADVAALVEAWRATPRRVVAVSNEVGQGVVPGTAAGRAFRDRMGRLNQAVAAVTEDVRWCVAGRVVRA